MDKSDLLNQWHTALRTFHIQHILAAKHNEKMHKRLGVPVVILGAVVGTSVFANLESNPETWVKILIGSLSVTSAVLAALQTFMGFSDLAEKHKNASTKYGMLRRELEQFMATQSPEDQNHATFLEEFRKQWDQVDAESPNTQEAFYERAYAQVHNSD